jgi:PhoH-like ATPase
MPRKVVYQGISVVEVASLDDFYKTGRIDLSELPKRKFFQNENLVIKATKGSALAIVKGTEAVRVQELQAYGISPRNKEQILGLNMLLDPSIAAVTLTGAAGTGKTLLTIAAALQQSSGSKATYRKIIYIKSAIPVGKEIGFLPGNFDEKLDPFFGALHDCIHMCGNTKDFEKLTGWDEKAKIQKMASAFVRGRTFRKAFVIVDECQNFSTHELKTMLTRLDDDSKIVLVGDIDQADIKLKPEDDGLVQVIETFREESMFGHINLIKSERSKLAQLVAEKL